MLFSSSDLLQSHIDIEHYSFPCQYCTEEFGTIDDYAKHGSYEHSDNVQLNWFECDICGFYYPSAKDIQDHTRVCRIIKVEMKEIDSEMQEIRNVEELMSFEQTDVLDSHQDVLDSHQEEEKFSG
jgi:flavoprotein